MVNQFQAYFSQDVFRIFRIWLGLDCLGFVEVKGSVSSVIGLGFKIRSGRLDRNRQEAPHTDLSIYITSDSLRPQTHLKPQKVNCSCETFAHSHVSYSLNPLKGDYIGVYYRGH